MKSKWLDEQESIINNFRKQKRGQFPMIVGMVCFMLILFGALAFINGDTIPKEQLPSLLKSGGIFIGIIALVLFLASRQNNKKGCPDLRKKLEKILTTQEEINEFDAEMNAPALHWVKLHDNDEYFFTNHYLVSKSGKTPLTIYNIFKLSDIYSTKTICFRDKTTALNLGKEYFTNLCDKDRQILGGITIKKTPQYEEFIQVLQRFVPDVRLGEGR